MRFFIPPPPRCHVRFRRHGTNCGLRLNCALGRAANDYLLVFVFSSLLRFTRMHLRSLCGVLLLLCFSAVPGLASSGQRLGIRRAHQPRRADQIIRKSLHPSLWLFWRCHNFLQTWRTNRWVRRRHERTYNPPSCPPARKWPLCPGLLRLAS